MRYLEGTRATVDLKNARLWTAYEAEQRAARDVPPDCALDTRDGEPLPIEQAVTNGTNGYALLVVSADGEVAALPLDEWALSQHGAGGVDLTGHKDLAELDARIRAVLDSDTTATEGTP